MSTHDPSMTPDLKTGQDISRHRKVVLNQFSTLSQSGSGLISLPRVTIGSLPDNALLDIFDFCRMLPSIFHKWWHGLVHVCRNWRYIMFASPLRLNLQLECNARTSTKKTLNVWPRLPIIIKEYRSQLPPGEANIIAALKHRDRVCQVVLLDVSVTILKPLYKVMKRPYPMLTDLRLALYHQMSAPVVPDSFLGGSAPRLRSLSLWGIPFPALPKLLLSCHDLVHLQLKIPDTGYIYLAEAMATALSVLTKLETLFIRFEPPTCRPDQMEVLPPQTHVVLPALTLLNYCGANKYFENLVARIHTPSLSTIQTEFYNQLNSGFDFPHFVQFMDRTQIAGSFQEATLRFMESTASIFFGYHGLPREKKSYITIFRDMSNGQLGCIAQICRKFSPFFSGIELLQVVDFYYCQASRWTYYLRSTPEWLELLQAFTAVHHMEISPPLGETIASALQGLTGERALEVLPMLRHLYLGNSSNAASVQQAIEPFISSRRLSNHPIMVHLKKSPL